VRQLSAAAIFTHFPWAVFLTENANYAAADITLGLKAKCVTTVVPLD
jgi:hypothetical protein